MPVKINSSSTGSVTLDAGSTANNYTLTLPAATGTAMVSGNMPAFSAYLSTSQSISSGTVTKANLNTEVFDTASCFDSTTNYRFTPNVAGYYQINGIIGANGSSIVAVVAHIYKNGSNYRANVLQASVSPTTCVAVSDLIYMNGSTDYIELYGQINATSPNFGGTSVYTSLSGALVRAA